jgi:hypothetical protein
LEKDEYTNDLYQPMAKNDMLEMDNFKSLSWGFDREETINCKDN